MPGNGRGEGGSFSTAPGLPRRRPARRRGGLIVMGAVLGLAIVVSVMVTRATVDWHPLAPEAIAGRGARADSAAGQSAPLIKERDRLRKKLQDRIPKEPYIVINTNDNRIYLRKGLDVLLDGVCSSGSYKMLESPDGRHWLFQTPRGMFRIKSKQEDPVWVKPDWAFIEEGEPIPPKNSPERYQYGALGLYAMGFGDGYFIHGTLYTRLLGRSVTHGCVRLDDKDLEVVFKAARVGTRVYIY